MSQILPTANEINPFSDLDGLTAKKHFLGKSLDQVVAMLAENSTYYVQDFMWMGPKAFTFYLPAVLSFAEGHASDGQIGFINSICSTLEFRLENQDIPAESLKVALRVCKYIISNYSRFEVDKVDKRIYGDLRKRFKTLMKSIEAEQTAPADRR